MADLQAQWQDQRAVYLTRLKTALSGYNATVLQDGYRPLADVYARWLRAKTLPAAKEASALIGETLEALDYDTEKSEWITRDDGTIFTWRRGEIKWFIVWFSISIRRCHKLYGDDFVRYVRRFHLGDCYRSQGEREPAADYDRAFVEGWARFVELADSYDEPLAAQRVIARFATVGGS